MWYAGFDFHAKCGKTASKEAAKNLADFMSLLGPERTSLNHDPGAVKLAI